MSGNLLKISPLMITLVGKMICLILANLIIILLLHTKLLTESICSGFQRSITMFHGVDFSIMEELVF